MRTMQRMLMLMLMLILGAAGTVCAQEKKKRLLIIGQSKGYQHEAISTAMVTLYNLGRSSGEWDTYFRTDCTAITKKPLKWGAKNLNDFDAVVFFTDGDLDMDDSQKADLLAFVTHALALVRVGATQPADVRRNLADLLLVDPGDRELRR